LYFLLPPRHNLLLLPTQRSFLREQPSQPFLKEKENNMVHNLQSLTDLGSQLLTFLDTQPEDTVQLQKQVIKACFGTEERNKSVEAFLDISEKLKKLGMKDDSPPLIHVRSVIAQLLPSQEQQGAAPTSAAAISAPVIDLVAGNVIPRTQSPLPQPSLPAGEPTPRKRPASPTESIEFSEPSAKRQKTDAPESLSAQGIPAPMPAPTANETADKVSDAMKQFETRVEVDKGDAQSAKNFSNSRFTMPRLSWPLSPNFWEQGRLGLTLLGGLGLLQLLSMGGAEEHTEQNTQPSLASPHETPAPTPMAQDTPEIIPEKSAPAQQPQASSLPTETSAPTPMVQDTPAMIPEKPALTQQPQSSSLPSEIPAPTPMAQDTPAIIPEKPAPTQQPQASSLPSEIPAPTPIVQETPAITPEKPAPAQQPEQASSLGTESEKAQMLKELETLLRMQKELEEKIKEFQQKAT
jgi:hypothetical protein